MALVGRRHKDWNGGGAMMRGFALVVAAGLVVAGNAQGAPRILWGVDGSGGNTSALLYQIDSGNGSTSSIGAVGVGITGLAVDPTTGTLYGVSNSGTRGLYQINRSTGAGVLVGAFNPSSTIADITFDASGQLYGWAEGPDDLARIDKA